MFVAVSLTFRRSSAALQAWGGLLAACAATAALSQTPSLVSNVVGGQRPPVLTTRDGGHVTPDWGMAKGMTHERQLVSGISGARGQVDYALNYVVKPLPGLNGDALAVPGEADFGGGSAQGRLGWQLDAAQRFELTGTMAQEQPQHLSALAAGRGAALNRERELGGVWLADWTSRYSTRLAARRSHRHDAAQLLPHLARAQRQNYAFENHWQQGRHSWTASLKEDASFLPRGAARRSHDKKTFSLAHVYKRRAQRLALDLGYTRDSEFGVYTTGGLAWDYTIVPQWRVSMAADSAVRVPTLDERVLRPGSSAVRPEENRSLELHMDWEDDGRTLGFAVYRRHLQDLVSLAPATQCQGLAGCGSASRPTQLQGVTLSGKGSLGRLDLGGSLDLQHAVDADSHLPLPRQAHQVLKLDGSTRLGPWHVGPEWQLVSRRYADANRTSQLAGYGRLDVQASASFAPAWEVMFRVDNATDRNYRLSSSRAGSGRVWRVQLRWAPG